MKDTDGPQIMWSPPLNQLDNDCGACVNANLLPRQEIDKTALLWEISPTLYQQPLPESCTLVFNPFDSTGVVVLNQAAAAILEEYSTPQKLSTGISRQLASLNLLQPHGHHQTPPQVQPDVLTAWLHVTNECNLRCTYCYVQKTPEAMTETTGFTAIEAIFQSALRHQFNGIKLKYAGGEATLNFELLRSLHHYAQELAQQHQLDLSEVVMSNGVALSNEQLDFFRDNAINLMISLDGIGDHHDAQRVFSNGRGSFKQVAGGINRAIARGLRPHLSITITGQNVDGLALAVDFALEHDLSFNLNFYRHNDNIGVNEEIRAEEYRLITAMRAAFAVIEQKLPQRSLINSLVDRVNFGGSHTHTCGAGHNYMVIDHQGKVTRCQMEMSQSITDILADDPLLSLKNIPYGFQNVAVDEKVGCRDCDWRYWCTGGCPLLTHQIAGRSNTKSPYCHVYQALFPAVLRLEALRLQKWHDHPSPQYH